MKDVGEGHHAQQVLGFVHKHQPVHLWVHRGSVRGSIMWLQQPMRLTPRIRANNLT